MRRRWSWFAGSLVFGLAGLPAPAGAATIVEKAVAIDIRPDGAVVERTRLAVRLDDPRDLDAWSPYPIYIDDHRLLTSVAASALRPDGQRLEVRRKDLDTVEYAGEDVLHSSQSFRTVSFPAVPVGSVLSLDYTIEERPYFRSGFVALAGAEPIERLTVEVRGGGAGWRWRLDGSLPGVAVRETAGGVTLTGERLAAVVPPQLAPEEADSGAVLRYAWGEERDWAGVGRWYQSLLWQVPRADEAVRRRARDLIAGIPGRRERLAALLDFARRQVRYVAVEVGIGGYRPHAPAEVLGRGWGDCKDKALLLVELLREAGIAAYPALIRAGEEGRLDRDFPSVDQFNHVIVAVPAEGLGLAADDPVAGGYLFLDATQTQGGLRWLSPWTQDQEALVVHGDGGELVRTPIRQAAEARRAEVDLTVDRAGDARGEVRLALSGDVGAQLVALHGAGPPEPIESLGRELFGRLLPGAALRDLRWAQQTGDLPQFTFAAKVELPGLLPGLAESAAAGGSISLQLPGGPLSPAPSLVEGRALPVVASPGRQSISWKLTLPAGWCPIAAQDDGVANSLGSFRQRVADGGGRVTIERTTEVAGRWIEPASFPALKELALAEHRGLKRRVRLECREAK